MKHVRQPFLPTVPSIEDGQLRSYLTELSEAVRKIAANVHTDLSTGQARLEQLSAQPAVSALDKGQMTLFTSGGNNYLITRIADATHVAPLSGT